jgi:transcriptional regulator of arginine metabolism
LSATSDRRRAVRALLLAHEVENQAQLAKLLAAEGYRTTQPQHSRDRRALQVVKQAGIYRTTERVTRLEELALLLRDARAVGPHLVVIRSEPGAASAIARALEADEIEGVVGTVAGDDTLFAAVVSGSAGTKLARRIGDLIEEAV